MGVQAEQARIEAEEEAAEKARIKAEKAAKLQAEQARIRAEEETAEKARIERKRQRRWVKQSRRGLRQSLQCWHR